MTMLKISSSKLKPLSESLPQKVHNFANYLMRQQQEDTIADSEIEHAEAWSKRFEGVDRLEVKTTERNSDYHQHLLSKYRQQGLTL